MRLSAALSRLSLCLFFVLLSSAGCAVLAPVPTQEAPVELTTATPLPTRPASPTPRRITSPTIRPTATITATAPPTVDPGEPTSLPPFGPPYVTLEPDALTQLAPDSPATLEPNQTVIGQSVAGRALIVQRVGHGSQTILLVGGIHGGWENNTTALVRALSEYYAEEPSALAPGVVLQVLPLLNPDGAILAGYGLAGRWNANGVDLNRNWGCDWSAEAFWVDRLVDPGASPFSEPESAALADAILVTQPAIVINYHSPHAGVYPGACSEGSRAFDSTMLARRYAEAAGLDLRAGIHHADRTGRLANWVAGQGIPALTVEMDGWLDPGSGDGSALARHIAGLLAVQCELVQSASDPASRAWKGENCPNMDNQTAVPSG